MLILIERMSAVNLVSSLRGAFRTGGTIVNDYVEDGDYVYIFRPYITVKGVRKYHPEGKMWRLKIRKDKFRQ